MNKLAPSDHDCNSFSDTSSGFPADASRNNPPSLPPCSPSADPPISQPEDKVARLAEQLSHFFDPDEVIEIRALKVAGTFRFSDGSEATHSTFAGRFHGNELQEMARAALDLSGRCQAVYYVLNPLAEFVRQAPRMQRSANCELANDCPQYKTATKGKRKGKLVKNGGMIGKRRRLFIDIDRNKTSAPNEPATLEEKESARALTQEVVEYLRVEGFPQPVVIDSGNGFQLIYKLPNLPSHPDDYRDTIKHFLHHLAEKFDGDAGTIDTKVFNLSRLARFPGPLNCKGADTIGRPHRHARFVEFPKESIPVSVDLIAKLASRFDATTLTAAAKKTATSRTANTRSTNVSSDKRIRRASAYLEKIEGAVQGQRGSYRTFRVACKLIYGFDLSFNEGFPLFLEWNDKCDPPWEVHDLERKWREAEKQPGERGSLLNGEMARPVRSVEEDAFLKRIVGADYNNDSAKSHSPKVSNNKEFICGTGRCSPGCICGVAVVLPPHEESKEEQLRHELIPKPLIDPEAIERHERSKTIHDIIGKRPHVPRCGRAKVEKWNGNNTATFGQGALVELWCGCWNCHPCRERYRWKKKIENVPMTFSKATHIWTGGDKEWKAIKRRFDRAEVEFEHLRIHQGSDSLTAILVVKTPLPDGFDDSGLKSVTGEEAATTCARAIDWIPASIPSGTRKIQASKGWKLLANPPEDEPVVEADEGAIGIEDEATDPDPIEENPWKKESRTPTVTIKEAKKILDELGVEYQRGKLDNWESGGAISDSLVWENPIDPALNAELENRLFGPTTIPECLQRLINPNGVLKPDPNKSEWFDPIPW